MADRISGDRVFCHRCGERWPRAEHGLTCPHCESDFVEIVDETNEDDDEINPQHEEPPIPPQLFGFAPFIPNTQGERGDGNVTRHHYRTADGRFSYTSTTIRSPQSPSNQNHQNHPTEDPLLPIFRNFNAFLQGVANNQQQHDAGPPSSSHGSSPEPRPDHNYHNNGSPETPIPGLWPRDANRPQGDAHPLRNINDILGLFQPGAQQQPQPGTYNGGQFGPGVAFGPNPLAIVAQILGMGRHGDAVYSQEELDRVISELIDQNMNGTAPGPASEDAIRALPKKKIDKTMMGTDGKAECSICMDSVPLETEVTILPCKHWFHDNCISAWLQEHDTCPHCRQGIMASHSGSQQSATPGPQPAPPGSANNPYIVPGSSPPTSNFSNGNESRRSSAAFIPQHSGENTASRDPNDERPRSARSDGQNNGFTGWMRYHFGGGNS